MELIEGTLEDVAEIMGHVPKVKETVTETANVQLVLRVEVIIAGLTSLRRERIGEGDMIAAFRKTLFLQKTLILQKTQRFQDVIQYQDHLQICPVSFPLDSEESPTMSVP